ncbi:hypothetical protein CMI41_04900 [Candidatus Pacearchaeota archaeon]|nr:hypothetical protein [Candidatus Pacearchaeota archaeon]|tara:strand:+ start:823 stop:1575 length:753 start_codon:yes stop_codon:yes gene_type:complete
MKSQVDLIHNLIDTEDRFIIAVLDACRYDIFKNVCKIPGELERVVSEGPCTREWIKGTWTKEYFDIAYVAGSPYTSKFHWKDRQNHFKYVDPVWDWGWKRCVDGIPTVPADAILEGVKRALQRGHKKIVAHSMQPHAPYIGEIPSGVRDFVNARKEAKPTQYEDVFDGPTNKHPTNGMDLVKAYTANLVYVINNGILPLLEYDMKIIVTSDHGETLGEEGKWGEHGAKLRHIPALKEVPWFTVQLNKNPQ